MVQHIQDYINHTITNNAPILLVEHSRHAVGPQGFCGVYFFEASHHFVPCEVFCKLCIHLLYYFCQYGSCGFFYVAQIRSGVQGFKIGCSYLN